MKPLADIERRLDELLEQVGALAQVLEHPMGKTRARIVEGREQAEGDGGPIVEPRDLLDDLGLLAEERCHLLKELLNFAREDDRPFLSQDQIHSGIAPQLGDGAGDALRHFSGVP